MSNIKKELIGLSDFAYGRLRGRLEGLTDDEYFWEPVPSCWTIHADGRGDWGMVWDEPAPFTTIAWRLSHIVDCLWAPRCALWLGLEPVPREWDNRHPVTAEDAIALLERAHAVWRGYIEAMSEERLWQKQGEIAYPYHEETSAAFVLHILDELIHHGAEVGVLRDLYRAQNAHDPFVEACFAGDRAAIEELRRSDPSIVERALKEQPELMRTAASTGRWKALPILAEFGFTVDSPSGRTALHHAAASGNVEAVRTLVELGADLTIKDPTYHATPLGWAEFMSRQTSIGLASPAPPSETVEYLRSLTPADQSS